MEFPTVLGPPSFILYMLPSPEYLVISEYQFFSYGEIIDFYI